MPCGGCKRRSFTPSQQTTTHGPRFTPQVNHNNPTAHLGLVPSSEFMQLNSERQRIEKLRRQSISKALGLN